MNKYIFLMLLCVVTHFSFAQYTTHFVDAQTVVMPGQYKISVVQKDGTEKSTINFSLFKKTNNKWEKVQTGSFTKGDNIPLAVTTTEDLNNDGYADIKISYARAGRGANELEKLFIFNPSTGKFIEILNSQEYPNLHYNKKRNCINSFAFSGGNTTSFLNLKDNMLVLFALVHFVNNTVSSYKVENNKETLLKEMEYKSDDAAVFFSDFDPIEE